MVRTLTVAVLVTVTAVSVVAAGVLALDAHHHDASNFDDSTGPELAQFESPAAFRAYVESARATSRGWNPRRAVEAAQGGDAASDDGGGDGTAKSAPVRISGTNVQEAGVGEPDLLKTDSGERVAFYAGPHARQGGPEAKRTGTPGETTVVDLANPRRPAIAGTVDVRGRMLLADDRLVVLSGTTVYGYDVSDPADPKRVWNRTVNGDVVAARLVNGTVYVVVGQAVNEDQPCPVRPVVDGPAVACTEVHHPTATVDEPATYTTVALSPGDGSVTGTASVVASAGRATTYVSGDAVYLTYTRSVSRAETVVAFVLEREALDETARERLRDLRRSDRSPEDYREEVRATLRAWEERTDATRADRRRLREDLDAYLAERQRELVRTGVVRVGIGGDGPRVATSGEVPGVVLNQFSMDARDGRLRIATTIPGVGDAESVNDVYVLDDSLDVQGSAQGMGEGQRVYAARFVGETAYLVTFRRVDPFHVVDLSDPADPEELGAVKLPGFSEYLHPIGEDRVLGVGRENGSVKAVVFDVSTPSEPRVVDSHVIDDRWSAVSRSHHAFLQDARHEVVFVPGSGGGHVFGYDNDASGEAALTLQKRVDVGGEAVRALYVGDVLYVFGHEEVAVVDETAWQRLGTLDLDDGWQPVANRTDTGSGD